MQILIIRHDDNEIWSVLGRSPKRAGVRQLVRDARSYEQKGNDCIEIHD